MSPIFYMDVISYPNPKLKGPFLQTWFNFNPSMEK